MADFKTYEMIERFERRLGEIEAQIKPQLDEASALRAGLERLRREAEKDTAGAPEAQTNAGRHERSRRTMRATASRNRR